MDVLYDTPCSTCVNTSAMALASPFESLIPSPSPCDRVNLGTQRQNSPNLLPSHQHLRNTAAVKPIACSCQNAAQPLPSYDSVRSAPVRPLSCIHLFLPGRFR